MLGTILGAEDEEVNKTEKVLLWSFYGVEKALMGVSCLLGMRWDQMNEHIIYQQHAGE